jgi:hypothetical protein
MTIFDQSRNDGGESARSRKPSTGRQRLYIRTMFTQVNASVLNIGLMHRRYFVAAGLPEARHDRNVDDVLTELTQDDASALIRVLEKEVPRA